MSPSFSGRTVQQTVAAIEALDLTLIKFKATRREVDDGYGWSPQYADQMELAYKRYLILHAKYPEVTLAPERDIDRFWHMHILDTRKYAADCEATFGHFLHHFPYLGLRGEGDEEALQDAFDTMQRLYTEEFGEPMGAPRAAAWCSVESPQPKAAWCSVENPQAKAAWCSVESPPAKAAWCSVENPQPKAAWCSIERPQAQAQAKAAWCSIEQPAPKVEVAWCSVETPKAQAAWCSVETAIKAAWCSIEAPRTGATVDAEASGSLH